MLQILTLCMCTCKSGWRSETTFRSLFFPSIVWVSSRELRQVRLCSRYLYLLSHMLALNDSFFVFLVRQTDSCSIAETDDKPSSHLLLLMVTGVHI